MTRVHISTDVMVPMRDGVRLAMDVYSPFDPSARSFPEPHPAILIRTSYDKSAPEWDGVPDFYVRHGYVFVIQDIRSRYKSEGDGRYYHTCNPWEGDDGYDTIEWLARQPWSNGRVGMMGSSHRAIVQTQAALHSPPHLSTICPEQGPTNIYLHEAREGGAMALHMFTAIQTHALDAQQTGDDPAAVAGIIQSLVETRRWLTSFPLRPGHTPLAKSPHLEETLLNYYLRGEYDDWWAQECNDQTPYWDRHADIPCLITGGWYDPFVDAATGYFAAMKDKNSSPSRLIIGPWSHGTMRTNASVLGEVEFGQSAVWGYPKHSDIRLRWFDRWLKDRPNGVEQDPRVEIFVMGGGTGRKTRNGYLDHGGAWRAENEWPIARTQWQTMYFSAGGRLTGAPPAKQAGLTYEYDPAHPVPSAGGSLAHLAELVPPPGGFGDVPPYGQRAWSYGKYGRTLVTWGPVHQDEPENAVIPGQPGRRLADRDDVLTFETPPLAEDLEVTGNVTVRLWVSSSAPDTDFTAKLVDVYPPSADYPRGFEMNLTDTVLRMRYRESWTEPRLMEPGTVYPVEITLPATSNLFVAGHRLRIDISSSNFPRLELNPNTGEPVGRHTRTVIAKNTVHTGPDTPSQVVLPVIPQ